MASQHERGNTARNKKRTRIQMTWMQVDPHYLRSCVHDITSAGCAVVLGRTTNGSALSVCILAGNDKVRDYIGSMDDIEPVLEGLMDDVQIDRLTDFASGQGDA